MKYSLVFLSLVLSTVAWGGDLSCKSKTILGEDILDVNVAIAAQKYTVSGVGSGKVLEDVSLNIDGVKIKECMKLKEESKEKVIKCVKNLLPKSKKKNDSKLSLYKMLAHINLIQNVDVEYSDFIDMPTEEQFDISKVTSGHIQVFEYGGTYPNRGIYTYTDAQGAVLGRFYYRILPSLCK